MQYRFSTISALAALLALSLAGCAAPRADGADHDPDAAGGTVAVVTSTNVYADIATQIGGDRVAVTALIDSPDRDPHEFEADARDQLAISRADIVIENGGGYDDFVDTMLKAAGRAHTTVLNAVAISGYDQEPAVGEFNEHVWYDIPTVEKVTERLVEALTKAEPASAALFAKNGAVFMAKLAALEKTEAALKAKHAGTGVAITEPVPLYMLQAIGLHNRTPDDFSEAIEEDTDVAPGVLKRTIALFSSHTVALLVYNVQTGGPQTEAALHAAKENGIPVVAVTETLPAGDDYISWMSANLDAVSAALST